MLQQLSTINPFINLFKLVKVFFTASLIMCTCQNIFGQLVHYSINVPLQVYGVLGGIEYTETAPLPEGTEITFTLWSDAPGYVVFSVSDSDPYLFGPPYETATRNIDWDVVDDAGRVIKVGSGYIQQIVRLDFNQNGYGKERSFTIRLKNEAHAHELEEFFYIIPQTISGFQWATADCNWKFYIKGANSLPVEWAGFDGKQQSKDVFLNWSTSLEENASFFEVQRSFDGNIFESVGNVNAIGNSQSLQSYSFRDRNIAALDQEKLYYRLRQVDLDGRFAFSETIEVEMQKISSILDFDLQYLNLENKIRLNYAAGSTEKLFFDIINLAGQRVHQEELVGADYVNSLEVSTATWNPGAYIVRLKNLDHMKSAKVIVN